VNYESARYICDTANNAKSRTPENEANAALIAAAVTAVPELLSLLDAAEKRANKAMRALESLTPRGSEFVNDVERCVAFVRESNESKMRAMRTWAKRTHAAESRLADLLATNRRLEEALKDIVEVSQDESHPNKLMWIRNRATRAQRPKEAVSE
jgi:hypothetical protein